MKRGFLVILLYLYCFASGQVNMGKILKSQLKSGVSGEKYETDYPTYEFTLSDIKATEEILEKELTANGYIKPNKEEFAQRIKNIFGRIIDPKSTTEYLLVNFENKCSREFKLFKNSNTISVDPYSVYIFKKGLFISDFYSLPEIIDYTQDSRLINYEDSIKINNRNNELKIYYWKDVSDLKNIRKQNIKTIVARNMYFFNDTKTYSNWLVQNDKMFVKNIIKVFGYDREVKFNEYVINELNLKPLDNVTDLLNFVATKNCNNELEIRSNFITTYNKVYANSKNVQDILIIKYLSSRMISDFFKNKYNHKETSKILAYLANTYDPLFKQNHNNGQQWGQLTILADYRDYIGDEEWRKVKEEYKK